MKSPYDPPIFSARRLARRLKQALSVLGKSQLNATFPPARAGSPDSKAFVEHRIDNAAGSRRYLLYAPATARRDLPLLVMLHGCKQSAEDFAVGTRMNELAAKHSFLVAYPEQAAEANPNRCWNWFNPGDQQRGTGEPSLIADLARQILREYPVDASRIFVAGLSAGGAAASVAAFAYPDIFAGLGVHSGLPCGAARDLPSAWTAMRSGGAVPVAPRLIPSIVFHGDHDAVVNVVNGSQIIAQSRGPSRLRPTVESGQSADGTKYTRSVEVDGVGRTVLEQWTIHGGDHAWSGGNPAGSFARSTGPDASSEMVRFFFQL